MKILICADMEGVSGVIDWDDVTPGTSDYERFRAIMTEEVNVVIRAAWKKGVNEIIVTDSHEVGHNILIESIESRVYLNSGLNSPLAIVQGVEMGVDGVVLIGFHARMGAPSALLCHTWSGVVANLWLNDVLTGEIGLAAAVCGHYNVPVIMISGDAAACGEACDTLGTVETAVVKYAHSRTSASCLPLSESRQAIFNASVRAFDGLKAGKAPAPYIIPAPVRLTLECMQPEMADRIEAVPGTTRLDACKVEYTASDILEAYQVFRQYNDLGAGE